MKEYTVTCTKPSGTYYTTKSGVQIQNHWNAELCNIAASCGEEAIDRARGTVGEGWREWEAEEQ